MSVDLEHVVDGREHVPVADAQALVRRLEAELVAVAREPVLEVVQALERVDQAGRRPVDRRAGDHGNRQRRPHLPRARVQASERLRGLTAPRAARELGELDAAHADLARLGRRRPAVRDGERLGVGAGHAGDADTDDGHDARYERQGRQGGNELPSMHADPSYRGARESWGPGGAGRRITPFLGVGGPPSPDGTGGP